MSLLDGSIEEHASEDVIMEEAPAKKVEPKDWNSLDCRRKTAASESNLNRKMMSWD